MATLRCQSFPILRSLLVALIGWAFAGTAPADEAKPVEAPRPIMRLPRWIESIGGSNAPRKPAPTAGGKPAIKAREGGVPAGVQEGQTPAPRTTLTPRPAAEPAVRAEVKSPMAARRLAAIPDTGATSRLTAEWTEAPPASASAPASEDSAAKPAPAGESGGLKRWLTDRVGPAAKPLAKPASTPATASVAEPVTHPEPKAVEPPALDRGAPPTVNAPVAVTPDEMPILAIDPASFRGVYPGRTTREELRASWGTGEPFTREDGSRGLFWKIEPFERVEVTLDADVVAAIRIKLAEAVAVAELAKQLEISDLRTVSILDEQGVSIGEVFPERGVIFSVKPGTQSATAVMIEPLDPESFVLRAEGEMDTCSAYAMADLQYAIEVDPRHLRAHRMLMVLLCEQGKWQQALRIAESAERIDPSDPWTRLKHAAILMELDRLQEARAAAEAVKSAPNAPPLVTAQVERLLGRIELAGEKPDHHRAVEHFAEAIRRSSALLTKRAPAVQQAAREIMLDAHLGTAEAIAEGNWQQKSRVIPKWMARSEAVVAECKAEEDVRQALELKLCRGALAVSAGSAESIEPLPWVKRLLQLRDRMSETVRDPWRRREIDWVVGCGLLDGLAAAQLRGDATDMLDNSTLTAAYLEKGGEHRELTDAERKKVGDLLFRIGIMYSLQRGDHATAVTWFDRVIPMWDENPRLDRDAKVGQLGESYVSMAISYWQVDRREDALTLSRRGVDLMVAAVDAKQLEERALAVAYGNLSTMFAEQGDETQSQAYAEMASRAEASGTVLR